MAEKAELKDDQSKQEADTKTTLKEIGVAKAQTPWPLIIIGIVGSVVMLALLIGGWWFVASQAMRGLQGGSGAMSLSDRGSGSGRMFERNAGREFGAQRGGLIGMAEANGVVTAIDGDTITVAGNGKKVTVKKTDSTIVSGDKNDITVNDSVIISGTTADDGTITASRIVIRNMTLDRAVDDSAPDDSDGGSKATNV